MKIDKKKLLPSFVGFGILFPLFFTLSDGVYRNPRTVSDSYGIIEKLPLPISILTCLAVLFFLITRLNEAKAALLMIAGTIMMLLFSLWFGGDGIVESTRKIIIGMQVALPLMGLLVGQLVKDEEALIAKSFLLVIFIVAPLQLIVPQSEYQWESWKGALADHLYIFTIYSHIQYVALVFVCAFVYSLVSLWGNCKILLILLSIIMLIYVMRSYSYLTMVAYGLFMSVYIVSRLIQNKINLKSIVAVLLVMFLISFLFFAVAMNNLGRGNLVSSAINTAHVKVEPLLKGEIPSNLQERFRDWELFGKAIIESNKTILVGHPQPMPREIRTSPHNWYIDIAYTFGLIALLPMFSLIAYTVNLCWGQRKRISAQTWWLAGIAFYLVIIDSNFKVTLRQPYPGIFAFFMWGMLLTRLSVLKTLKPR